jgi:hypothetical protein
MAYPLTWRTASFPFKQMVRVRPSGDDHACHGLKSLPRSSRICPANDRETLRNDGNGRSIESAGQASDSAIAAGSEIGPENTLKVETRIERRGFRTSCPTAPACKVADRYVNQGDRPIVTETPGAVLSRVQCGTTAGHMSSGSEPEAPE